MLTKNTIRIIEEIGWGQKWFQKGFQEGSQKGLQEYQLKIARRLLVEGDSLAKISRIMEISVKTLKKKLSIQL